ncbi:hypothetical protein C8250_034800 [Streptomyces sp. So13.3]|uniref:hypothetical protein n=1 Tax=Streptomyces TaxID=1883 RepID=UPI00110712C4|nr:MULTISPECIES: hypothetical protein [unclassified Streptomyces]MCZ4101600.1 hypothetical protein [Streptomyces sp. H39-C1]QNA76351.1 hypothetical protein C8250_034800 [Streptomyces sp. So13.3]
MLRPARLRRSRRVRLLNILPVVLVLLAAGAFIYASKAPQTLFSPKLTAISIDQAVEQYRQHPTALREDLHLPTKMPVAPNAALAGFTAPAPGVYTYATQGQDWVEYNGQKYVRPFPAVSPATVLRSSGCGWELYFQTGKEYTDGHRQCSAPGEFLCMAHISEITFGSVHRAMTHVCNPGMVQVGGKAVGPGGRQSTICYASGMDSSRIDILFKNTETVMVGGKPVQAYHVELDSSVQGELNGTAVADVWFETHTGTYLKMIRKQDTSSKLPDGSKVNYRVRVTYELQSLTPRI